jgi:hypothetical protein
MGLLLFLAYSPILKKCEKFWEELISYHLLSFDMIWTAQKMTFPIVGGIFSIQSTPKLCKKGTDTQADTQSCCTTPRGMRQ